MRGHFDCGKLKGMSSLALLPQDLALLHELYISRELTLEQIAKFHFQGSIDIAKRQLHTLRYHRLVKTRRRFGITTHYLTQIGFKYLKDRHAITCYRPENRRTLSKRMEISDRTIRHELAVADVKVALLSSRVSPLEIPLFITWPWLIEFTAHHPQTRQPAVLKPDGFFVLRDAQGKDHFFYVEVDMSTERHEVILNKAALYRAHAQSGEFARMGSSLGTGNYHFRVLLVTKTKQRRNELAMSLLSVPILMQVWLTTKDELETEPWGAIWMRPADVRKVLDDSPFWAVRSEILKYKRDNFINDSVQLHRLLS